MVLNLICECLDAYTLVKSCCPGDGRPRYFGIGYLVHDTVMDILDYMIYFGWLYNYVVIYRNSHNFMD